MANDSRLFVRPGGAEDLPLFEAKMIHQYNHRFASYALLDRGDERAHMLPHLPEQALQDPLVASEAYYHVPKRQVVARLRVPLTQGWLVGLREVTSAGLERTLIATAMPLVGTNHKIILLNQPSEEKELVPCLLACLNSIPLDFCTKQKLGGASLSGYVLRQLPVPRTAVFRADAPWYAGVPLAEWIRPRVLELAYTSISMERFGLDFGWQGPPFLWNGERRILLRAELDAALFHLYGLLRDESEYVLDAFELLRERDEKEHGEYRTKRIILEIYEAMAEAARTGQPYATRLDPPPADPRVAHPPRTGPVIPFPSRPLAPPAWGPELFPNVAARVQVGLGAGAWGTIRPGSNLGMAALAAVLRNLPGPCVREDVERAVVLVLLPRLMLSSFDRTSAKTWRDLIGRENFDVTSVSDLEIPWNAVIRKAIHQHVLAEETDGRWRAGADIADVPSPELDARALVVLSWLETAPSEDAEVTRQREGLHVA